MRSNRVLKSAIALALAGVSSIGFAQQAPATTELETVVVTGSYIRGTAKDTALPVDVIHSDDLLKQGAPSMVEMMKTLPASSAVIGDANQFGAGRTEGSANINLRTLGPTRTLVLINGRRITNSAAAAGVGVDLNTIAPAAIGRVEVLKDGAAATYGSDAIGGVVNFITKKGFTGLDLGADFSKIDGSDGDYTARASYGWKGDSIDGFIAGGYQHRSMLPATARDFVTPKFGDQAGAQAAYLYNPQGGWSSAANPGTYLNPAAGFASIADPACGQDWTHEVKVNATQCLFRYADFDHLVEDTDLYQVYGELNFSLTDSTTLHIEALYARADVKGITQSVTYGPNQYPTTLLSPLPFYQIPATNPGLIALKAANPAFATAVTGGLYAHPFFWRPMATGGNPLYGNGGQESTRKNDTYRFSADLTGKFGDGIGWDFAATYSQSKADQVTPDFLVDRLQLALQGFGSLAGGPTCDRTVAANAGNNAVGCYYFNPFSTGIAGSPIIGSSNPQYVAATANSAALVSWIYGPDPQRSFLTNDQLVVDAVLDGKLPISLPGGDIAWAFGGQYRDISYKAAFTPFTDNSVTPCVDTILTGTTTCAIQNGPYTFYGNYAPVDLSQSVYAVFAEFDLPILDTLSAQIAVRYEDIQDVGSTTNPKLALRWKPLDWLVFRGSVGTTFRAPPPNLLVPSAVTALAFTTQSTSYKPFDNYGNPNLKPETADTFSVGTVVQAGGFYASIDYWSFNFDKPLIAESGLDILNTIFPGGASLTAPNNCATAGYAALVARVTFNGACSPANIVRTRTNQINGPKTKTSGIDFSAAYNWDGVLGGDMTFGLDGTYTLEFKVADTLVEGIVTKPAYDAAGKLNYLGAGSLPKLKGSIYLNYTHGMHNVRWTGHYIGSMTDDRPAIFASTNNGQGVVTNGQTVDSWFTHDFVYRLSLPSDFTVSASVVNAFDTDPPFARLDYSYDPYTANPLGRVFKVGVEKKF